MTIVARATIIAGIKSNFFFLNFGAGGESGGSRGGGVGGSDGACTFLTFIIGNGDGTLSYGSLSYFSIGFTFLGGLVSFLF